MDNFSKILEQIKSIFQKMSPIQRTNFFLLTAIVTAFIIFVAMWAGRSSDSILFSNLTQKDAAQIMTKLEEMNIAHRVDGNAVYVDSRIVHETRLMLANEGLPQGGSVGYEIFGKPGMVMTDYMQKMTYKRALEGELARTIKAISGIHEARVHLTMPKKSLFRGDEEAPTASVVLDVGMNFASNKGQVGGIVHLVASSVEGLRPDKVTVVDSRGNLLSGMYEDGSNYGLTNRQTEIVKAAESYLENKASSMLTAILGHGRAIVRVSVDMDFDIVERTEERYDPESAVARIETRTEEVYNEKDNTATAEVEASASKGKSKDKTKEKMTTNYEINRSIEKIISSTGSIKRLSVAVVVDGMYKEPEKKSQKREYIPRSIEEKEMYKKLVMNSVGFDKDRGDTIQVSDAAFDNSYFDEEARALASAQQKEFILDLVKQISIVVVFVLVFLFLWSLTRQGGISFVPGFASAGGAPVRGGGVSSRAGKVSGYAMHAASAGKPGKPLEGEEGEPEETKEEEIVRRLNIRRKHPRTIVEEEMKDMVMEDPDVVAQLVRMWMDEEEV